MVVMFVGATACGKECLLTLLKAMYKYNFNYIVILCPTIQHNKMYLSRKWLLDDVFLIHEIEVLNNSWIPSNVG